MASTTGSGRGTRTVLITDMVGSTALRTHLGDNDADRLRDEHERLLRDTVSRHGGAVVKSTGDGVMAVFDGATDGIECAVGIQHAVAAQARRTGLPVEIRIGVAAGDVTWDDDDYHGTPVVEAARLEPKARPGTVLVSELVRLLAGTRTDVELTAVGPFELKGLPGPVTAYEIVVDTDADGERVPLPDALPASDGTAFVGRDDELAALVASWERVRARDHEIVLVTGDAGIGKTRLAAELARRALAEDAVVLYGHCDEDLDVPYQPFFEALRHFVEHTPSAFLADELGPGAGELVPLVPDIASHLPGAAPAPSTDAGTARFRLFEAVSGWLRATSSRRPVVLVVDDLQWASKGTILLLRHLARASEPMRLLVLATWRDTDVPTGEPLPEAPVEFLAETSRTGRVTRVRLAGLGVDDVSSLVDDLVGAPASARAAPGRAALAEALHGTTEGNPLFVHELVRDLLDVGAGSVDTADARAVERFGVPETVRDVVLRRVARLDERVIRVLAAAAVAGRAFEIGVLEDALDARGDDVIDALEISVAAGLVREHRDTVGQFEFSSGLVRDVLYEQSGPTRRARLHERIADALERRHGDDDAWAAEIASHLVATARPGDAARAVGRLLVAGRFALRSLAYEQAVTHLELALSVLDRTDSLPRADRLDVLLAVGDARFRVLDFAGSKKALQEVADEARVDGDADRLARAALALVRQAQPSAREHALGTLVDEALAALPDDDSALRAQLLATRAAHSFLDTSEGARPEMAAEAVAMAERVGDPGELAFVLAACVLATFGPALLPQRTRYIEMQLEASARSGHVEASCEAHGWRATARIEAAERAGVDDDVAAMTREAEALGQPWYVAMAQLRAAMVAQLSGDYERAEELANASLSASTPDQLAVMAAYAGVLWTVRRDQGRLAEVEPALAAFAAQTPDVAAWQAALAVTAAEVGRRDDAAMTLRALAERDLSTVPMDWFWLATMTFAGEVAWTVGDADVARTVSSLLAPFARRGAPIAIGVGYVGTTSRALGLCHQLLGDLDAAAGHLQDAIAVERSLRAPAYEARAQLALARVLVERGADGDRARAGDLLAAAGATAERLALVTVAADVESARASA
ncbi:MAG TPA: AAA family ATPase [Acidimicrobiia bacterium]|nr:AAA family ATPase [Acidimicrobiia bacterium]